MSLSRLRKIAARKLDGVGNRKQQWEQWTGTAFHIRRRLNGGEQKRTGEAIDMRGTPEASVRALRMGVHLQRIPPDMLAEEIGGRQ